MIGGSQDHTFPISLQGHMTALADGQAWMIQVKHQKKVPFVQVLLNTDKHLHD